MNAQVMFQESDVISSYSRGHLVAHTKAALIMNGLQFTCPVLVVPNLSVRRNNEVLPVVLDKYLTGK